MDSKTIEQAKQMAKELLDSDKSGHGMDHSERVLNLSLKFAENQPVNADVVALIALLHDVDDYKLFGDESAKNLTNAKNILASCGVDENVKNQVVDGIKTIGYSKRLQGIMPTTIEAKIVSDADMCDAMGIIGMLRSYQYNISHGGQFFDRNVFPVLNMSGEEYKSKSIGTSVTHMFEKILKLKDYMLTEPGREEATKRHSYTVDFLYHLFEEENAPEWTEYLTNYLK